MPRAISASPGTPEPPHDWQRTVGGYGQSDIGTVYLAKLLQDKLIAGMGETNGMGSGAGPEYIAWC